MMKKLLTLITCLCILIPLCLQAGPLTINGTQIQRDGVTIKPVIASSFSLFREDIPIAKTKAYIDQMYLLGIRGFRVWNLLTFTDSYDVDCTAGWVWSGRVIPKELQDRSCLNEPYFQRADEILSYLKSKNMYCLWALSDASVYIGKAGVDWYTAKDHGWEIYLDRIIQLWQKYNDILIISTGNEVSKGHPNYNAVSEQQTWLVNYLWDRGVRNIAGNPKWIREFYDNPRVQILEVDTSRNPMDDCILETIDELNDMLSHGRPVISSEPPRAGYGWAHGNNYFRDLLKRVAQATINCGCWYCHHGIGSGEIDDLVDQAGKPWWGVTCRDNNANDTDWLSIINQLTGVTK